jgi:hypothetical protein
MKLSVVKSGKDGTGTPLFVWSHRVLENVHLKWKCLELFRLEQMFLVFRVWTQ